MFSPPSLWKMVSRIEILQEEHLCNRFKIVTNEVPFSKVEDTLYIDACWLINVCGIMDGFEPEFVEQIAKKPEFQLKLERDLKEEIIRMALKFEREFGSMMDFDCDFN